MSSSAEPSATGDQTPANHSRARMQVTILLTMYIGYAGFMLCRNTLIASSAEMIQDPALNLDKESFGRLMSWHSAGAIAGKLVTGIGADLIGGRRMFLLALSLTALANVGFAFCSSFLFMGIWNFLGQFFKAGGWPAMTKIVGVWYPPRKYGQVWSIISTSSRVGTIAATFLLGLLLSLISWRAVFVFSALVTGVIVIAAFFFLKENPQSAGLPSLGDDPSDAVDSASEQHALDKFSLGQACVQFAKSGRFWLIGFGICFLTILMDFINFIPIYLAETLEVDGGARRWRLQRFPRACSPPWSPPASLMIGCQSVN